MCSYVVWLKCCLGVILVGMCSSVMMVVFCGWC